MNRVELIGYYGGDETHALSAWTSTSRELTEKKRGRINKLLNMLAKEGHHSPFEKSMLHFLVTCDTASHIHILKHRVAVSVNGECLSGDTLIPVINNTGNIGKSFSIKNLFEKFNRGRSHQNTEKDKRYQQKRIRNMRIRCLNENSNKYEIGHIKDILYSGKRQTYKITLEDGKFIICSDNHKVYTQNGWATLRKKTLRIGVKVATNGVSICVKNKPWTYPEFFIGSENYTRKEFAKISSIKYELCKKWGYIFNINFKEDPNKNFKKGNIPWNKNIKGYKLNISPKGLEVKSSQGKKYTGPNSPFWRGGVTSYRANIGAWTTLQAPKVHKKFNWCCQICSSKENLHAHHIIPVSYDESKAKDFDNLISVCQSCHTKIHSSSSAEIDFIKYILGNDFNIKAPKKKLKKSRLQAKFVKINSIEEYGIEDTFDLEIEGTHKNFVANGIVVHNSGRYKELKDDKYHIPWDWPLDIQKRINESFKKTYEEYHDLLDELVARGYTRKRAKESARLILPYANQLILDVSFNFRSFMHFISLRNKEDAQLEINEIASNMLELVRETGVFKYSLEGFGYGD